MFAYVWQFTLLNQIFNWVYVLAEKRILPNFTPISPACVSMKKCWKSQSRLATSRFLHLSPAEENKKQTNNRKDLEM